MVGPVTYSRSSARRQATLIGAAIVILCVAAPAAAQPVRKLALVGGMVLDGYDVPPIHHAAVLIEGERITWVGRAVDAKIPPDATVVDTSGRGHAARTH